jgi:hypothetical protein
MKYLAKRHDDRCNTVRISKERAKRFLLSFPFVTLACAGLREPLEMLVNASRTKMQRSNGWVSLD